MVFLIPSGLTTWEAVAAVILAQSQGAVISPRDEEIDALTELSFAIPPMRQPDFSAGPGLLNFDAAFRKVEQSREYYGRALAETNGLEHKLQRLVLPGTASEDGSVILCPFPINQQMALPASIWRAVARHLRSYGVPVVLLGDRGQVMREGMFFAENDILSDFNTSEKLNALAGARLIVGVPNAWTWLATAWDKKMLLFYPDSLPERRWMPWVHDSVKMFVYEPHAMQIPIFLTLMRRTLKQF